MCPLHVSVGYTSHAYNFPGNEHFGLVMEFAENGIYEYVHVNYNILSAGTPAVLRVTTRPEPLCTSERLIKMHSNRYTNNNNNISYVFLRIYNWFAYANRVGRSFSPEFRFSILFWIRRNYLNFSFVRRSGSETIFFLKASLLQRKVHDGRKCVNPIPPEVFF